MTADNIVRYKVSPLTEIRHSLVSLSTHHFPVTQGHRVAMILTSNVLDIAVRGDTMYDLF